MKPNDSRIDPERLAALLDGKLTAGEREEILAQLAASPDDLEVLADVDAAMASQPEPGTSTASPEKPISRGTPAWRRPPREWLAIAAVIAGLSVLPTVVSRYRARDDPSEFVRFLTSENRTFPRGWDFAPWGATRSPGDVASLNALAWRVGARVADLQVAVVGQDTSVAPLAEQVASLLSEVPAAGAAIDGYRQVAANARGPRDRLTTSVRNARRSLRGVLDDELVVLGAWSEVARLAAAHRDAGFFASSAGTRLLDDLAQRSDVPPTVASAGARARADIANPPRLDWDALSQHLSELLAAAGR